MNTYYCGLCGKHYSTIEERSKCEQKCIKEAKEAEEKAKKEKIAKEKEGRMNIINDKIKELEKLCNDYYNDYGYINIKTNSFTNPLHSIFDWWL